MIFPSKLSKTSFPFIVQYDPIAPHMGFVAQCLDIDIAAQGSTSEEAVTRLKLARIAEMRECEKRGVDPLQQIGKAPFVPLLKAV